MHTTGGFTRQTPVQVLSWVRESVDVFPPEWTLDKVAQDCFRRFGSTSHFGPSKAVIQWSLKRLATCRTFTSDHWSWIVDDDDNFSGGYRRMIELLKPAIPVDATWRKHELSELSTKLRDCANTILENISEIPSINVALSELPSVEGPLQYLVTYSKVLEGCRLDESEQAFSDATDRGMSISEALVEARNIFRKGYREPSLRQFLSAFLRKIESGIAPTFYGDFGGYPAQKTALRRAIIMSFLPAMYERRTHPTASLASVVEAICLAWFESAPSQPEINRLLREQRKQFWPKMEYAIEWTNRAKARKEQLLKSGVSPAAAERQVLDEAIWEEVLRSAPQGQGES